MNNRGENWVPKIRNFSQMPHFIWEQFSTKHFKKETILSL